MALLQKRKNFLIVLAVIALTITILLIFLPSTSSRQTSFNSRDILSPASSREDSFAFAVIGDTQRFNAGRNNGGLQKAVKNISKTDSAFVIALGDIASSCRGNSKCGKKWKKWKKIIEADVPQVYPVMGNHDRANREADALWQNIFNLPANGPSGYGELVYSFNYANSHFVVLNSEVTHTQLINSAQREWLEQDLRENPNKNIFVFFHQPAWPASEKIGESLDVHPAERDALWRIFAKYNVKAVFSGHEHMYSRRKITSSQLAGGENEVYQFIVCNTDTFKHKAPSRGTTDFYNRNRSYVIVQVSGQAISVKNYSVSGKLVDEFQY